MIRTSAMLAPAAAAAVLLVSGSVYAQYHEEATVKAAAAVLQETMTRPSTGVPQKMLADSYGVAIIPNVLKGGFVVGARHGRGVLLVREQSGIWNAPVFITLTGGNIGWQVGVQSSDIILVFKTQKSVQGILSGKLTLGADAAAAAGPVGRQGSIGTDAQLKAEIYSYSRSRGLFAGVSIDGSVIRVDQLATGAYYRNVRPGEPVVVPESAQKLTHQVAAYAGAAVPAPAANQQQTLAMAQQHSATDADVLRGQLAKLAPELYELLDDQWKAYLALPSELFLGNGHPSPAAVQAAVEHFNVVASDPRFQTLAQRAEFQSVHGILKHYQQSLTTTSSTLQLPPPPPGGSQAQLR